MTNRFLLLLLLACLAAHGTLGAQSPDAAAERARIANQRIQAEAQRREQEALEKQRAAAEAARQGSEQIRGTPAAYPTRLPQQALPAQSTQQPMSRQAAEISTALEQLRQLGLLRDAGYVTETEFERIKQRILDSRF